MPLRTPDGQVLGSFCVVDTCRGSGAPRTSPRSRTWPAPPRSRLALRLANSELMLASTRTQAVLDSAADAFVSLDAAGTVLAWNLAAERMFGTVGGGDPRPPGGHGRRRRVPRRIRRLAGRGRRERVGRDPRGDGGGPGRPAVSDRGHRPGARRTRPAGHPRVRARPQQPARGAPAVGGRAHVPAGAAGQSRHRRGRLRQRGPARHGQPRVPRRAPGRAGGADHGAVLGRAVPAVRRGRPAAAAAGPGAARPRVRR